MKLSLYQVDAFAAETFQGNPAAVVPLERWPDDGLLAAIAAENNLSETAFLVRRTHARFELRWFTPTVEVDLCGHATLASAWVVSEHLEPGLDSMVFATKSGDLTATRRGESIVLDFPRYSPVPAAPSPELAAALGQTPIAELECERNRIAIFKTETDVRALRPDFRRIAALGVQGVVVTARGDRADFVSRYFAPAVGIDEDPVTGANHSMLVPLWRAQLGKSELRAQQVSARGGELRCIDTGERVLIAGHVAPYLVGTIEVPA